MRSVSPTLRLSAGVLVALVAAELLINFAGPLMPEPSSWPSVESDLKSEQLAQADVVPTLVFLGSSITEAAVDPAILEAFTGHLVPYNAALPFSNPLSQEIWLKRVVLPAVNPELLVIGIPVWPAYGNDPGALGRGIEGAARESVLDGVAGWSALIDHRGVLAEWDRLTQRQRSKTSGLWTDSGHQTAYYDRLGWSLGGRSAPFREPETSIEQAEALERMIVASRKYGAEVVLLLEPGRLAVDVAEVDIGAYISWLEERSAEWGVELWDTYSIEWAQDLYADRAHFNRKGTVAYTTYLAELINDLEPAS